MLRRCQICGGEIRFSHREYAGRGVTMRVFRCTTCGSVQQRAAHPDSGQDTKPNNRKRQAIDEGPPTNPVIDAAIAARLLGDVSDDDLRPQR